MARRTKAALDEFRNQHWDDFTIQVSESSSAFWRAAKIMKKQRAPLPLIRGARGVAFSIENKVEAFAETLERQCSLVYGNADVNCIGRVHQREREILTSEEDKDLLRPTSPEEVKAIIKAFRPTKPRRNSSCI
ncbi:hypothetical protein Trydic_g23036 [Trypoxylus dichotomus]